MASWTFRFSVLKILMKEVSFRFQEFLKLTDFAESGAAKDKLLWAFRIYDKDRSGEVITVNGWGASVLIRKKQGPSL